MALMPDSISASALLLRRSDETDAVAVVAAIERSIDDLRPWMPWASDGVPAESVERAVLRSGAAAFDRDAEWSYLMIEVAGNEVVGGCGVHRRQADTGVVDLGYWVRSDRQGQGYATTAAGRLTDVAFERLAHVREVHIRMDAANVASRRVPEKLGYRRTASEERPVAAPGHTGGGLVWSVTREQWAGAPN